MTNRPGKFVSATVDETTYSIPEYWLIGQRRHRTIEEAIRYWHYQSQLAEATNE